MNFPGKNYVCMCAITFRIEQMCKTFGQFTVWLIFFRLQNNTLSNIKMLTYFVASEWDCLLLDFHFSHLINFNSDSSSASDSIIEKKHRISIFVALAAVPFPYFLFYFCIRFEDLTKYSSSFNTSLIWFWIQLSKIKCKVWNTIG